MNANIFYHCFSMDYTVTEHYSRNISNNIASSSLLPLMSKLSEITASAARCNHVKFSASNMSIYHVAARWHASLALEFPKFGSGCGSDTQDY